MLPPYHGALPESKIGHRSITPVNCPHELVIILENLRFSDWVASSKVILANVYICNWVNEWQYLENSVVLKFNIYQCSIVHYILSPFLFTCAF